jgi:hypothetical protein
MEDRHKKIVLELDDFVRLISKISDHKGITCISKDCRYHHPYFPSQCGIKVVLLRKGICKYYQKGQVEDRTDIPFGRIIMDSDPEEESGLNIGQDRPGI